MNEKAHLTIEGLNQIRIIKKGINSDKSIPYVARQKKTSCIIICMIKLIAWYYLFYL